MANDLNRRTARTSDPRDEAHAAGWNACLDAIEAERTPAAPESGELAKLREDAARRKEALFIMSQCVHNLVVADQSAWIEWKHGAGAEAAMQWIQNGLAGPGHIPAGQDAQAWFDANYDDRMSADDSRALPQSMGKGEGNV